jgi:hypothetical protein
MILTDGLTEEGVVPVADVATAAGADADEPFKSGGRHRGDRMLGGEIMGNKPAHEVRDGDALRARACPQRAEL